MLAGDDDVLGVVVTDVEFLDLGDVLPSLGVNRPPVGLHNQFQFLPTGLNRRGQVKGLALEKKRILQNTILNPGRKIVKKKTMYVMTPSNVAHFICKMAKI